jgi:antitoxin HigA-1
MTMHNPAHLDDILKGLVTDSLKLTITDVALHLDISQKILSKVLNARWAVTPEMTVRLEMEFGNPSADHWLKLQNAYDLWQTRQHQSVLNVLPNDFEVA